MEFSTCEGAEGVLEFRILRWAFDTELVSLSPPPFASLISLFLQNCVGDAMQNARQRATVLAGTSNASTLLSSLRSNPTPQRYSHTFWPSIAPRFEYQRLRNRHESPCNIRQNLAHQISLHCRQAVGLPPFPVHLLSLARQWDVKDLLKAATREAAACRCQRPMPGSKLHWPGVHLVVSRRTGIARRFKIELLADNPYI
jgi:hypothetical protein